ncbi:hypothetical protein BASA81_010765 [Batrachochytrium salamandrivorans]|nr:hypothetical protein BASA81_010765 [Batrachochytrium salamandrivorans]
MEASLRTILSPTGLDEEIVDYLVLVAKQVESEQGSLLSKDSLIEALSPFLETYSVSCNFSALELPESMKTQSTLHAKKKPIAGEAFKKAQQQKMQVDDWGTSTLPNQHVQNTIVDRIETPAERRRRERKLERDAKAMEMDNQYLEREIEQERLRGVANQITTSARLEDGVSQGDICIDNITLTVGSLGTSRDLLENASLKLSRGGRYGLIGRNGFGKSTLLTKLARREIDHFPRNLSVLYVSQEVSGSDHITAVEQVLKGDAELTKYRQMLEETEDPKQLERIHQQLVVLDSDGAESRARAILNSLGFSMEMQNVKTKALSGGWRMRAALASALFGSPDLLLLDEPTNGLSLDALVWLEDYIENKLNPTTTLIVVSHDRVFLNNVVGNIIQIEQKELHYFKGNVDAYEKTKEQRKIQNTREREAQLGKIAHMQKFVDKFRYSASRASLAQSRLKAIGRLESVLCDEVFSEPEMRFEFPDPQETTIGPLIVCEDVGFGYSSQLFSGVDFNLSMGSKVVLLGLNGKGKSTFVKLLLKTLEPTSGMVKYSRSQLKVGLFAQHSVDQLNVKQSALEFMLSTFPGVTEVEMRPHLARFGVTAELCSQRIGTLSGGQKSRVAFALVTWPKPSVLLLDEPSSHLDMETADALNMACAVWPGALFIISHDQNLISTVPEELWLLENKHVGKMEMEFADFKRKLLKEGCGSA